MNPFTGLGEGWNKELTAYRALFCRDAVMAKWTNDEKMAWYKLVASFLQNVISPWFDEMEEMGFDMDFVRKESADDARDVCFLRFYGLISAAQARELFVRSWDCGDTWQALGLLGLNNEAAGDYLLDIVKIVLEDNGKSVADYKSGKVNAANSLLGQTIKRAKAAGKNVDPNVARELILKTLG